MLGFIADEINCFFQGKLNCSLFLFPKLKKKSLTPQSLLSHCSLLDWRSVDLAFDPAGECVDVGVDTGLVPLPTAVAPAHHTGDVMGAIVLTHQGST